ncbi:MAG TPA: GIY-YIG nuclease family protein [Bacteroidales bacterium]|nr:GIY-YIG nuclease family protein [Bacteroidales bacterium]
MENQNKFYIYAFQFPNNKYYIGKTSNLIKRYKQHIRYSKKINNNSLLIHKAINKYKDNYKFNPLFSLTNEELACEYEKYFINIFNSFSPNGYNLTLGGEGVSGYKGFWIGKKRPNFPKGLKRKSLTEEHKNKIANKLKGKINNKNPLKRPIYCPELQTSFLSLKDAGNYLNINNTGRIAEACQGIKRKRVKGLHFQYIDKNQILS